METSEPPIVAPSFGEEQGNEFEGMEEDFNDEENFDDFSMEGEYGSQPEPSVNIPQQSGSRVGSSGNVFQDTHQNVPRTNIPSSSWDQFKFGSDNAPFKTAQSGKVYNEASSHRGGGEGDFQGEFDEFSDYGADDYQNYDDGYDDNMVNSHYVSPEKQDLNSMLPPQQPFNLHHAKKQVNFGHGNTDRASSNPSFVSNQRSAGYQQDYIAGLSSENIQGIESQNFAEITGELDSVLTESEQELGIKVKVEKDSGSEENSDNDDDDDEDEDYDNEGDEEYEEDKEDSQDSEGEYSEEVSDDEDINEALNSLGDLDAVELGLEEPPASTEQGEGHAGPSELPTGDASQEGDADKPKKKRKRKKKGEGEATDGEGKQKRKRKKKGEKAEDGEKKKADNNARKNIRKILSENKLEQETLDAQNAELERQRRLQELKKQQLATLTSLEEKLASLEDKPKKEKDSQLKSLLQSAEEEAEKETVSSMIKVEPKSVEPEIKPKKEGVIDISSGEDDEDVVMLKSEGDEEEEGEDMSDDDLAEAEDVNNSGSHINDQYNVPDENGKVLVNVGHPTSDPDIYLSPLVGKHIKPHQIGGVRFLYDNLVECINRFKTSSGFGCILAHSMGLGKTIQMIGFIDIFLRHTGAKSVMVIVPINTLANWMSEFNMWVPDKETCEKYGIPEADSPPRPYHVYLLNDNFKNTPARARVVDAWYQNGGVLLLGYEMYRLLSSKKVHLQKAKGRKKPGSDVIDVEEEDRDKKLLLNIHEALVNPGPDLVVCDEGHRIKNSHAGISMSLKQIKTKRRIVLTGYPLQNNLIEYWCMVDFVRPNFLGTKTEFCNMFERPIMNGQCADSTPQDMRLMRYRAHVLHSLLEGFVQRRGHTVLQAALPPKEEYVFLIRMSPIQRKLYQKFMESVTDSGSNGWVNNNPLKAFSVCCKIWNHPDILYTCMKKSLDDNDLDIETGEPKKKGGSKSKAKKETPPATPNPLMGAMAMDTSPLPEGSLASGIPTVANAAGVNSPASSAPSMGSSFSLNRNNEPTITYDWANEILKDYVPGMLENGGKMVILFNLISESLQMGDKILVFSQSLFTLNLIEEFLSKYRVPRPEQDELWCRNKNYFRLDGSTSSSEREKLINAFNAEPNKWLFLLSTRAGSLGINLVGANRVVVLDASWNPCHDCQAICRVYRFGQIKPSYIYRLVTENTMEKKIYDRQVNKQGMSDRVVDELNPQNQFRREHVDKLMVHENKEFPELDFSDVAQFSTDCVLCNVLLNEGHWLTAKPFTHESLLIDRKELKLTMKEKRLAKQSYVMEKRLNVSYSRPSYSAYYPRGGAGMYPGTIRGRDGMVQRPIASVKPMISTPVPMRPKIVAAPQVLKPGVSVHQVLTTTEIVLPGTNTTTEAGTTEPKKIPAGQQVLVIRTPKGVYIRTPDGKIFAVRSKPQPDSTSPLDTLANTGSNLSTGGVTIVRPTTTTTVSSQGKTPTSVTVIRPNIVSTSKPLTIIRQGPGPVRTIIPVTLNKGAPTILTSKGSGTTASQIATIAAQSQKISTATINSGTKIRIVTPNTSTTGSPKIGPITTLQTLANGNKKIISNSLAFSGGTTVIRKVIPKPGLQTIKRLAMPASMESGVSASGLSDVKDSGKKTEEENKAAAEETSEKSEDMSEEKDSAKLVTKDVSWNLPPIDMKAIKLPQFNADKPMASTGLITEKVKKSAKKPSKSKVKEINIAPNSGSAGNSFDMPASKVSKPKFTLSGSPSDSNLSGTQSPLSSMSDQSNSSSQQSQIGSNHGSLPLRPSEIDLHEMKLTSNPNSSSNLSQMSADSSGFRNWNQGLGNSGAGNQWENSAKSMSGYAGNQFQSSNVRPQYSTGFSQPSLQNPMQNIQTSAQVGGFFNPGIPDNSVANNSMSDVNNPGISQSKRSAGQTLLQTQAGMYNSNQNMFGNFGAPTYLDSQQMNANKNMLPGYGSQIMGYKAPVSNTMPFGQAAHTAGTNQNVGDFTMSGIHNNSSFLSELTETDDNFLSQLDDSSQGSNSDTPLTSSTASAQYGNPGGMNVGMNMMSTNNMGQFNPSGQANFDMFSPQPHNPGFYPNFGNNHFNANFGSQQPMGMSQPGGFPGGNMYPMGGIMQPGMFPYTPFAPYPYAPMMAPMPYYPMPFQPQYGAQGTTMGPQAMGQQGPQMAAASGMVMPLGGQQGDGTFQPGMGN
ncbi:helicase ARIP4-like isoform X2 [Dreissena polymorpha]|uniref:Helicase ARIP4 n=2 Tax=Dreissena polymorpha TaxID=45954 RepID=A0A9D4GRX0_DREPO|nr:helicase ARIP4-like isoform X2 [Dreissena polymorpha]KAH3820380.1 hypothetical protein DPMN_122126 [Dreissena polymorpha]